MILGKKSLQKIGAVLLSLTTVFGLGTMSPVTVHADGEEPEAHTIGIQIDGYEEGHPARINVKYSLDDGSTWYNPLDDDPAHVDEYTEIPGDFIDFNLEDNQTAWDAANATSTLQLYVRFEDDDNTQGNRKSIKAAWRNWEEDILNWSDPSRGAGDDYYTATELRASIANIKTDDHLGMNAYCLAFGYDREGSPDIISAAYDFLYASSAPDANNRKHTLAMALYKNFIAVPMYGTWELPIVDPHMASSTDFEAAVDVFESRIEYPVDGGTITVYEADGSTSTRAVENYRVNWGLDSQGYAVTSVVSQIILNNPEEFIVCTDFDPSVGRGTTYYARSRADEVLFTEDNSAEQACAICATSWDIVRAAGHLTQTSTFEAEGYMAIAVYTDGVFGDFVDNENEYYTITRIMNPQLTYVAVTGEGEPCVFGGLGVNGSETDVIWQVGDYTEARTYIGYSTIHIQPLCLSGLDTKEIVDVALDDPGQKDGVVIDKTDLMDVKVTFKSNYYDVVPLKITFAGGLERTIVIERIGLVFGYQYLGGNPNEDEGPQPNALHLDYNGAAIDYNHNYFAGEQIIVYATYYHPTNDLTAEGGDDLYLNLKYSDGTNEVIPHTDAAHGFDGYVPVDHGAVASTTFLLGFAPAKEFDGNVWTDDITDQAFYDGGVFATVVNAGFDDEDTYGGTQIGSEDGVYWDGMITWFNH